MATVPAEAVNAAIRLLTDNPIPTKVAACITAFLTGSRIVASGRGPGTGDDNPTITHYNEVVSELFGILPDATDGRLDPFRNREQMWLQSKDSGRKTVWDRVSRNNNMARTLFQEYTDPETKEDKGPYPKGGLRDNAVDLVADIMGKAGVQKPDVTALAAILLRSQPVSHPISPASLAKDLAKFLGISKADLAKITTLNDPTSIPLTGRDWIPGLLDPDLAPKATTAPVPAGAPASTPPAAPKDDDWITEWQEPAIEFDPRIRRMVIHALQSSRATLLVGPPGTGKTTYLKQIVAEIAEDPASYGFPAITGKPIVAAPDESWTTRDLVGGETIVSGALKFSPGVVLDAIAKDRWLILDEINRGDMDRIFGGLLTWLSGSEVQVGRTTADGAQRVTLGWSEDATCSVRNQTFDPAAPKPLEYIAGANWRMVGTYNAVDAQRVFRIGHALARRFARVAIPPPPRAQLDALLRDKCVELGLAAADFVPRIGALYDAHISGKLSMPVMGPAVFLRMLDHIAKTMTPIPALTGSPATPEKAITEAYAVGLGPYIHAIGEDGRKVLKPLVVPKALSEDEWTWLVETTAHA